MDREYKIGIYNDNNELVAGPYTVEADCIDRAREYAWDLAIGNGLYADEVKEPEEPDGTNNLALENQALEIAERLNADTAEENIQILRSFHSDGIITKELYDYIVANWDRLVV